MTLNPCIKYNANYSKQARRLQSHRNNKARFWPTSGLQNIIFSIRSLNGARYNVTGLTLRAGLSPSAFRFPLLLNTPPLLHTHLWPPFKLQETLSFKVGAPYASGNGVVTQYKLLHVSYHFRKRKKAHEPQ